MRLKTALFVWAAGCLLCFGACDSIEPIDNDFMVVEGFVDADKPLPALSLSHAQSLESAPAKIAIRDATLNLTINGRTFPYVPSPWDAGKYVPAQDEAFEAPARAHFSIDINWHGQRITTNDAVPPPLQIDSLQVSIPDKPVAAILVDTLRLDTPQVGARKGFIYPIDVQIWWTTPFAETLSDSLYWIESRLKPQFDFSSKVLDVFLLTEEVQRERSMPIDGMSRRQWKGVYAVPVADSLAPLPDHNVEVQLVRGSEAYGLYASSRNSPERREPVSNLEGAIGIVAGISLDSYWFAIQNNRVRNIQP